MIDPTPIRLDPASYRRTPWKNGGGVTVDIAGAYREGARPQGWSDVVWRLGRTRIVAPGPFSDLAGHDRILTVIAGRGLVLKPRGRPDIDARRPFMPVAFPGEWPLVTALEHGEVGVLNLIWDRRLARGSVTFPAAGDELALESDVHVLHACAGPARFALDGSEIALDHDWAMRVEGAVTALRHGSGALAVASVMLNAAR